MHFEKVNIYFLLRNNVIFFKINKLMFLHGLITIIYVYSILFLGILLEKCLVHILIQYNWYFYGQGTCNRFVILYQISPSFIYEWL